MTSQWEIFNSGENIDAFVVEKQGREALANLEGIFNRLGGKVKVYYYLPPRSFVPEAPADDTPYRYGLWQRRVIAELPKKGNVEGEFSRNGLALVVDDAVNSGRTLFRLSRFLSSNGYPPEDIFVYSRQCSDGRVAHDYSLVGIDHYREEMDKWRGILNRVLEEAEDD